MNTEQNTQALASLNGKQRRSRKRKLKEQQTRLRGKVLKKAIDACRRKAGPSARNAKSQR
jgi:hypothetical protein